jgi:hypothetical protein
MFLSDQVGLSAHWSCGTWPNYLSMSCEILRFRMLTESCALLSLLPTECSGCEMLQSCSPAIRSLSQMRDEFCCTSLTNIAEIIFHYRKYIWVHNTAPDWWIGLMCQCNRQKIKMYTKLPTYKRVVVDQYSRSLKLMSVFLLQSIWAKLSHFDYFKRALPNWGKLMSVSSHLYFL